MKRFLLFVYPIFYPIGGMRDFKGSFDTLEEAMKFYNEQPMGEYEEMSDYLYHVFDINIGKIVSTNDDRA